MQIEQMPMIRVFFSKTGRAKYISHLDTMRTLTRAFKRSGLPVWYTQGFNPHMYITFALPLSLGYESLCESADVRLTSDVDFDTVTQRLNKALPPGFAAVGASVPVQEPKEITWADYEIRLIYDNTDINLIKSKLDTFLNLPVIEVSKKTKKGEKDVDIKPFSTLLSVDAGERSLDLKLRMAAGITLNINPTLLLKAFYKWSGTEPDGVKITRAAILNARLEKFD